MPCVWLPGSVGATGGPCATLHCFVLVGTISAVVALATQSEFHRLVDGEQAVVLQAAWSRLHWPHL